MRGAEVSAPALKTLSVVLSDGSSTLVYDPGTNRPSVGQLIPEWRHSRCGSTSVLIMGFTRERTVDDGSAQF